MMRSPRSFSIVVRRKSGELVVRERPVSSAKGAPPGGVARWPFVRGVVTLVEAIKLGSEALRFSSDIYEKDHFDDEVPPRSAEGGGALALALGRARQAAWPGRRSGAPGHVDRGRRCSDRTSCFAVLLFVVPPRGRIARQSGGRLRARPAVAALSGADRSLQAHDRGGVSSSHPPLARNTPRLSVSRRRAQDDQHLRSCRSARRRECPQEVDAPRAVRDYLPRHGGARLDRRLYRGRAALAPLSGWGRRRKRAPPRAEAALSPGHCRSDLRAPAHLRAILHDRALARGLVARVSRSEKSGSHRAQTRRSGCPRRVASPTARVGKIAPDGPTDRTFVDFAALQPPRHGRAERPRFASPDRGSSSGARRFSGRGPLCSPWSVNHQSAAAQQGRTEIGAVIVGFNDGARSTPDQGRQGGPRRPRLRALRGTSLEESSVARDSISCSER